MRTIPNSSYPVRLPPPAALLALLFTSRAPMHAPRLAPRPAVRSHPWHHTRHHTARGFQNVWGEDEDPPLLKAATWGVSFLLRQKEQRPAPLRPLDPAALAAPAEGARLTWLGHSTVLLQLGDLTVLTDPVFADRVSPVSFAGPKREVPLPLDPADLPPVDLVLLSHDHYDHLDLAAIAFLHERDRPLVLVPLGVGQRLGAARTVEMDWWQVVETHGLRIHSAPAKHFSGRSLGDRDRTLWASWYLEPLDDDAPTVYYAGDSGYASHFADVRERFGAPDLAIVPVGAYEPRWFMARVHVSPDEALQAYEDLGGPGHGTHFVPVHWGTFDLADDPLDAPRRLVPQRAAERGLDPDRIHVLDVGGQVTVE
jgi:L-ascorbate metabolism protein UlaG (beta-lactamase superfamily)